MRLNNAIKRMENGLVLPEKQNLKCWLVTQVRAATAYQDVRQGEKMIRFIIAVCIFLILPLAMPAFAENEIGRYQLFQGEYSFINLRGEQSWVKALIKLDTATGKMYICDQSQVLGKYIKRSGEAYQIRNCDTEFDHDMEINDYTKKNN